MSTDLANKSPVFQLKASLYTLTTLHLLETDLQALHEQLLKLRKQAPKFFESAPVIVDFQRLNQESGAELDFATLKELLRQHNLIVVGLRHVPHHLQEAAKAAGFAILPNASQSKSSGAHSAELGSAKPLRTKGDKVVAEAATSVAAPAATPAPVPVTETPVKEEVVQPVKTEVSPTTLAASTMVITHPVRSGQQIYAKDADLVVISSVSPGAELIADGNIHVYGQLRGRALAGAKGNAAARIFCQDVSAELLSIAGHYWLHEDVMAHIKSKSPVQIFLKNGQLQISKL
ncbi:MAG: minC [Gammaproteobacteria bacterium]|jgi:septum site-determining protein MinC|nr:minC [Gammaproteobacteria bacterium]